MKPLNYLGVWICVGVLAACTSGSSSTVPRIASSVDAPTSSGAALSSEDSSSAAAAAGANCTQLAQVATTITTTVDELSLLVGTGKDVTALLADTGGFAPALGGLIPSCAPSAEDSMWGFLTAVEEMRQRFGTGSGKTEMGASKLGLIQVRATGADLYRRLGLDASDWAEVPASARPSCRDMEAIGARMTWIVRHLANLIGSDNVTNAEGDLVQMSGLTSAVEGLVADCRPRARAAMASFEEAVDHLAAVYRPGSDPAVVEADKVAFGDLRSAGISLYSLLGLDVSAWEVVPATER